MTVSWQLANQQKNLEQRRQAEGVVYHPPVPGAVQYKPPRQPKAWTPLPATVRHYPSLGIAFIKNELSAAGRVYLLCQALDQAGRGCLDMRQVRELLSAKSSPWRIVGRRRLRQILIQGEGLLWSRSNDRLWLQSPARVCNALQCGKLQGSPVALPLADLLGGIQQTRAAFLAAWHTGRKNDKPISQATVQELTGIPSATQRRYMIAAGVKAERQIAVSGANCDQANIQELTYRHGQTFEFRDYKGQQGKRGAVTVAWNLPNIYKPSYQRASSGRLKKLNRVIDLVLIGARGNGQKVEQIFHSKASQAAKAFNRDPQNDAYFPAAGLWGVALAQ